MTVDASISVIAGPFAGQSLSLAQAKFLIGREPDCHLQIEDDFVSRHHCVLLSDEYTLRIRDLGSKNGTFVNQARLSASEHFLNQDDIVAIGAFKFRVEVGPSNESASSHVLAAYTTVFGATLPERPITVPDVA